MEIWKNVNIENFENCYKVSNLGRVKSITRTVKMGRAYKTFHEKILKGTYDKDGYIRVKLSNTHKYRKEITVHRLVALTFIQNENNLPVINHKNGIKDDNRVENLEWCTVQHNTKHTFDVLGRKGYNGGTNKRILVLNECSNKVNEFESMTDASKYFGVSVAEISFHCKNKRFDKKLGMYFILDDEGVTTIETTSNDGRE